jgi:DNA-binding transcriptional MocR family regulator
MHLAALLPPGTNDVVVARKAVEKAISAAPLSSCCSKPPARVGLILGYGGASVHQIHEGVRKLRLCITSAR